MEGRLARTVGLLPCHAYEDVVTPGFEE